MQHRLNELLIKVFQFCNFITFLYKPCYYLIRKKVVKNSKMKRNLILVILLSFFSSLYGQPVLPATAEVNAFFNSKTLIVYEGSMFSPYNIYIKEMVEQYWKITPFEFIDYNEFEENMTDSTLSFLVLTDTRFERDKSGIHYNFINLLLGANVKSITEMPEIGSLPLSYSDGSEEKYYYKLKVIIRFLQNRAKELRDQPVTSSMKYLKYYNKNRHKIKLNTLLIVENDLSYEAGSAEVISKYYPNTIRVISDDELEKAISDDKDALFLHYVGPEENKSKGWAFKMIFGISNGQLYYYNRHTISDKKPSGFLLDDFKRISKN